jgi:hypothetical protein
VKFRFSWYEIETYLGVQADVVVCLGGVCGGGVAESPDYQLAADARLTRHRVHQTHGLVHIAAHREGEKRRERGEGQSRIFKRC